jgi:Ion channel
LYFAFVNYTTLGYGDVTPIARWRLLGPMTAMNGVLLFGWSTAVIFEVLRRTVRLGAAAAGPDVMNSAIATMANAAEKKITGGGTLPT